MRVPGMVPTVWVNPTKSVNRIEVGRALRYLEFEFNVLLLDQVAAIFFLLLLSLSEHIDFGWAYLVASIGCIGMIGAYVGNVLRNAMRGLGFACMLALLYAALYGLLISEDNALVLGSGLLFAILAALMLATRKVDWYQVAARSGQPAVARDAA